MAINAPLLAYTLLSAARGVARSEWKTVKPFLEGETHKLARTIADLEVLLRRRIINPERALQLFELQQRAAQSVLATTTTGGESFAAELLGAGFEAVRVRVLKTVGIDLLPSEGPAVPATQFRAGKDL